MPDLLDQTPPDDTAPTGSPEAAAEAAAAAGAIAGAGLLEAAGADEEREILAPDVSTPPRPIGRLRHGGDTKGRYVVLWARKPVKGEDTRPAFQEVDVVAAANPDAAKRAVLADDAPFAAFLRHSAAQKPGILLRAVPAMHWPDEIKPTTYTTPAPVLEIG